MKITFDPAKRDRALKERSLDFARAAKVFEGAHATGRDDRKNYGEVRYITAGYLGERFVVLVWTLRGEARHIISMRHGHAKEARYYGLE